MPNSKAKPTGESQSQVAAFRDLARKLECDEDEEAFKAKVQKIARAPKSAPKPKN